MGMCDGIVRQSEYAVASQNLIRVDSLVVSIAWRYPAFMARRRHSWAEYLLLYMARGRVANRPRAACVGFRGEYKKARRTDIDRPMSERGRKFCFVHGERLC
jgi:hypothetical protein